MLVVVNLIELINAEHRYLVYKSESGISLGKRLKIRLLRLENDIRSICSNPVFVYVFDSVLNWRSLKYGERYEYYHTDTYSKYKDVVYSLNDTYTLLSVHGLEGIDIMGILAKREVDCTLVSNLNIVNQLVNATTVQYLWKKQKILTVDSMDVDFETFVQIVGVPKKSKLGSVFTPMFGYNYLYKLWNKYKASTYISTALRLSTFKGREFSENEFHFNSAIGLLSEGRCFTHLNEKDINNVTKHIYETCGI